MTYARGSVELDFDGAVSVEELAGSQSVDGLDLAFVDFIAEYDDRYVFVRVVERSDPDARSSDLLCESLARSFRETFFFHIFGDWKPKRVEYAVLFADERADIALVYVLTDELKRRIPLSHPSWSADSALRVTIMTPDQWKKRFGGVRTTSTDQTSE